MAVSLNNAYTWAIGTCNKANVGYSQPYRNQQTINGITYYDCSSFIWYALKNGGFNVESAYQTSTGVPYTNNAITTHNMPAWLTALGWTQQSITGEWKSGDIVLRDAHTEMVYTGGTGSGVTMGAHSANYTLAKQVSINTSASTSSNYTSLWRYGNGGATQDLEWIKGNRYLTQAEMENNAQIVYNYLNDKGWTLNAICGLLGNMQQESTINPGIWQNLTVDINSGFGLVQWTPSTKYTNWASANGYASDNGNGQLKWINEQAGISGEWIPTTDYNITFEEYKSSTQTVEYCVKAWLYDFERAGDTQLQNRINYANAWYTYLSGVTPTPPMPDDPDNPPSMVKNKMPVWMMLKLS